MRRLVSPLAAQKIDGHPITTIKPFWIWGYEGSPALTRANLVLYQAQVRAWFRRLGLPLVPPPILWFYDYRLWPLMSLPHRLACYHCTEDYAGIAGHGGNQALAEQVRATERRLLERVDLVFAVSPALAEDKRRVNPNTHLIANGVDAGLYARPHVCDATCAEVRRLLQPIFGYTGNVSYKLDYDLLDALAQAYPHGSVVLVGPVSGLDDVAGFRRLVERSNVHLLGKRPVSELPAFLAHFAVCLIPFIESDWFVRVAQPLKTYEYLAAGKPVVTTYLDNLMPLRDVLYVSRTREAFLANVASALREHDSELRARRVAIARANDWELRFAAMNRPMRGLSVTV